MHCWYFCLLFCPIYDQNISVQTWAPPSTHDAPFVFFVLIGCVFSLSANELFIICSDRCLRNAPYLGTEYSFQTKYLYARKVFTSLVAIKYMKTWFDQWCVIHISSVYGEAWKILLWSPPAWRWRKWLENGFVYLIFLSSWLHFCIYKFDGAILPVLRTQRKWIVYYVFC